MFSAPVNTATIWNVKNDQRESMKGGVKVRKWKSKDTETEKYNKRWENLDGGQQCIDK